MLGHRPVLATFFDQNFEHRLILRPGLRDKRQVRLLNHPEVVHTSQQLRSDTYFESAVPVLEEVVVVVVVVARIHPQTSLVMVADTSYYY